MNLENMNGNGDGSRIKQAENMARLAGFDIAYPNPELDKLVALYVKLRTENTERTPDPQDPNYPKETSDQHFFTEALRTLGNTKALETFKENQGPAVVAREEFQRKQAEARKDIEELPKTA